VSPVKYEPPWKSQILHLVFTSYLFDRYFYFSCSMLLFGAIKLATFLHFSLVCGRGI
jgi:hypothetical protein